MNNQATLNAIDDMIQMGLIPPAGNFEVTEVMLRELSTCYHRHTGKKARYDRVSRRNSGKSLINFKLSRGISPHNITEGLVYLITNPAWPEYAKIGISLNLTKRLSSYQTSDPHRAYKLCGYEFVLDRRQVERDVIGKLNVDSSGGEWVKATLGENMIKHIRDHVDTTLINSIHRDRVNKPITSGATVALTLDRAYKAGIVLGFTGNAIKISVNGVMVMKPPNEIVVISASNMNRWKYLKTVLSPTK